MLRRQQQRSKAAYKTRRENLEWKQANPEAAAEALEKSKLKAQRDRVAARGGLRSHRTHPHGRGRGGAGASAGAGAGNPNEQEAGGSESADEDDSSSASATPATASALASNPDPSTGENGEEEGKEDEEEENSDEDYVEMNRMMRERVAQLAMQDELEAKQQHATTTPDRSYRESHDVTGNVRFVSRDKRHAKKGARGRSQEAEPEPSLEAALSVDDDLYDLLRNRSQPDTDGILAELHPHVTTPAANVPYMSASKAAPKPSVGSGPFPGSGATATAPPPHLVEDDDLDKLLNM